MRVNKIEEIEQQLVTVWQSSNAATEWKDATFAFLVLPTSAEAELDQVDN